MGRYTICTVGLIPGFLAGIWVFAFSDRVARLYSLSVTQIVLETIFKSNHIPISFIIQRSRMIQTFIFMTCSALILQMIRQHKFKIFWFVTPPTKPNREPSQTFRTKRKSKCTHKNSCQDYFLSGVKEYFLIGFALENIKLLVKNFKQTKSFSDYFKGINIYAIGFLVSYVGIYRMSYCLINKYIQINSHLAHLLAGFLGGTSFIFYPKPMILSYAIVLLCETFWKTVKRRSDKHPKALKKILKLPVGRALFPFTLATMVHMFVFHNRLLSHLGVRIVNGATNYKGDFCLKNLTGAVWKSQNF